LLAKIKINLINKEEKINREISGISSQIIIIHISWISDRKKAAKMNSEKRTAQARFYYYVDSYPGIWL